MKDIVLWQLTIRSLTPLINASKFKVLADRWIKDDCDAGSWGENFNQTNQFLGRMTNTCTLEPRGLIRLLQFLFAIFAFATACNGRSSVAIFNPNGTDISASWSYPYNLQNTPISISPNSNVSGITVSDSNGIKPSAEFFVFTGVTSMLLSLAFLVIYVLFDRQYRNNDRFPLVDLIVTVVWTILWFAGSAAWAKGVTDLRSQTDWKSIADRSMVCSDNMCSLNSCKFWT